MFDIKQVAEGLGFSVATIRRWTVLGQFPKAIFYSARTQRWTEKSISIWCKAKGLSPRQIIGRIKLEPMTSAKAMERTERLVKSLPRVRQRVRPTMVNVKRRKTRKKRRKA